MTEFKAEKPLSLEIWQSLRNNENNLLQPLKDLSDKQRDELNPIKEAFKEQLNIIGLQTLHYSIAKNETGFTFARQCFQKDCHTIVNLNINVINGTGTIFFDPKCKQHSF